MFQLMPPSISPDTALNGSASGALAVVVSEVSADAEDAADVVVDAAVDVVVVAVSDEEVPAASADDELSAQEHRQSAARMMISDFFIIITPFVWSSKVVLCFHLHRRRKTSSGHKTSEPALENVGRVCYYIPISNMISGRVFYGENSQDNLP